MKKIIGSIVIISAFILAFTIVLYPSQVKSLNKGSDKTAAIPDSIQKIFTRSCMDCHADDGNMMAKSHVNFSQWNNYNPEKQADKASAICKMLKKESMPPKSFRKNHPDLIPTQAQVDAICKWADSFKK